MTQQQSDKARRALERLRREEPLERWEWAILLWRARGEIDAETAAEVLQEIGGAE
jgi:hypothetical protein